MGAVDQTTIENWIGRDQADCASDNSEGIMGSIESERKDGETRNGYGDLNGRFGQIGISAVVAALNYRGDVKNPAYAPVEEQRGYEAHEAA
jgi:hypothetical protein